MKKTAKDLIEDKEVNHKYLYIPFIGYLLIIAMIFTMIYSV